MSAHPMSKMILSGVSPATEKGMEYDEVWPGDIVCLKVPIVSNKKLEKEK